MGAMQRRKGARYEREIVNSFKDVGLFASRTAPMEAGDAHDQYEDVAVTMSQNLTWKVQCKRLKQGFTRIQDWLKSADVLCIRTNGRKTFVVLEWSTFRALLESWVMVIARGDRDDDDDEDRP